MDSDPEPERSLTPDDFRNASPDAAALRKLQSRCLKADFGKIRMGVPTEIAHWILNFKREEVVSLERRNGIKILVEPKGSLLRHESEVEFYPREKVEVPTALVLPDRQAPPAPPDLKDLEEPSPSAESPSEEGPLDSAAAAPAEEGAPGRKRRRRRRRRGRGAGPEDGAQPELSGEAPQPPEETEPSPREDPEDMIEGARVTRIPQDLSKNFLERAMHFGRSVLAHLTLHPKYDVVQYRNIWDGLSVAQNRSRLGYKTLFEVNGPPSIELKYHYPGIDSRLLDKIKEQEIATLHLSDAILCPSNVTREYLASLGLDRKRVTVIPNGVSPSDFSPSPLPAREGRVPVLLYIGTLADWQGLEVVIRAWPKILEQQAVRALFTEPFQQRIAAERNPDGKNRHVRVQ